MSDAPFLILADHVFTLKNDEVFSPGALAVEQGRVLAVGPADAIQARFPDADREAFPGHCLMPGLINAHTDLSLGGYDLKINESFKMKDGRVLLMPWLVYLSRYKSKLDIPDQMTAVEKGLERQKRMGVTALGDRCRYPAVIPKYKNSRLRVVCLAEIENIQRKQAQEDFEQALALVDEILHEDHPQLTAGYAPFSAYTLSKNLLKILADHAVTQALPVHMLAAFSFSEMEFFYDSLGEIASILFKEAGWQEKIPPPHRMTPVQYLNDIGFLKAKPALLGCLHLGPTDAAILEHSQSLRLFSPRTFQFLQVGEIPWAKLYEDNLPWALGTLAPAWGSTGNLWDEMRSIFFALEDRVERGKLAEFIFRGAHYGGIRALGLGEVLGGLQAGKAADFILLPTPEGDESLLAGLLDQTREGVIASFVSGQRVY